MRVSSARMRGAHHKACSQSSGSAYSSTTLPGVSHVSLRKTGSSFGGLEAELAGFSSSLSHSPRYTLNFLSLFFRFLSRTDSHAPISLLMSSKERSSCTYSCSVYSADLASFSRSTCGKGGGRREGQG